MTAPEEKKRQDALRARRYRQRKKMRGQMASERANEIELPPVSDTELGRAFFGVSPKDDADVTTRFATRHDESLPLVDLSDPNYRGIGGRGDYTPSRFDPEARQAARDAEWQAEAVDYSRPPGNYSRLDQTIRERIISSLPNAVRRNRVEMEAHVAHAMRTTSMAEAPVYNESLSWEEIAAHAESAVEVIEPETEPHQYTAFFRAPWRSENPAQSKLERIKQQMAERNDNVSMDAPEGFR
jgi:hypothetical protein